MKKNWRQKMKKLVAVCLIGLIPLGMAACGTKEDTDRNLAGKRGEQERTISLFSPMEKAGPNAENVARSAFDKTIAMAEETSGIYVEYFTYTAENYQDKTYDDVS